MKNINYKKNEIHTGEVVDLTSQGMGVVKLDHYPFFVPSVIPGETIKFKITKVGKKFGFGRLLDITEKSPDRIELKDQVGTQIGTMTLQHMNYDAQLKYKEKVVRDAYERIGKFENIDVKPTLGMENPWEYRNKAQIPVRMVKGQLETGFFRKNSHDLVPVENFHIQHTEIDDAIVTVRDILREFKISPYNEENNKGNIRHVIVKRGHYTGQIMIVLVTTTSKIPHKEKVVSAIVDRVQNVVSVMHNVQPEKSNVILGDTTTKLWGQPYYEDEMLGFTFRISAQSFYQVNTPQAERMYEVAVEQAQLTGEEIVLDAYSGIGSISLALSKGAKEVYAMEVVPEAVEMAKDNAALNFVDNVTFELGSAEEVLPKWDEKGIRFDVAVVDPPRKGLDEGFIETLVSQKPKRIVYVSCNPASQARDARIIADAGYEIKTIQPVDLFAQTPHVECVILLEAVEA